MYVIGLDHIAGDQTHMNITCNIQQNTVLLIIIGYTLQAHAVVMTLY